MALLGGASSSCSVICTALKSRFIVFQAGICKFLFKCAKVFMRYDSKFAMLRIIVVIGFCSVEGVNDG